MCRVVHQDQATEDGLPDISTPPPRSLFPTPLSLPSLPSLQILIVLSVHAKFFHFLLFPVFLLPACDRFVNRLTDRDQMQLELANDSVHSSTEKVCVGKEGWAIRDAKTAGTRGGRWLGRCTGFVWEWGG